MSDSHLMKLRFFILAQKTIRIKLFTNNGSGTPTPNYPDEVTTYTQPSNTDWTAVQPVWTKTYRPTPSHPVPTTPYPQTTTHYTTTYRPTYTTTKPTGWTTRPPYYNNTTRNYEIGRPIDFD